MEPDPFAAAVAYHMYVRGVSHRALARRAATDRKGLSEWMRGRKTLSLAVFIRLMVSLGLLRPMLEVIQLGVKGDRIVVTRLDRP